MSQTTTKPPQTSGKALDTLILKAAEDENVISKYGKDLKHPSDAIAKLYAKGKVLRYVGKAIETHVRHEDQMRRRPHSLPSQETMRQHREILVGILLQPYLPRTRACEIADTIIASESMVVA